MNGPPDWLKGPPIQPSPVHGDMTVVELIERTFQAYNAARLHEGARLLAEKMLAPNGTVGLSLTGALTPAGLGVSCLIPLVEAGHVDWIVSTGANLYHDTHFALGLDLHRGQFDLDDRVLHEHGVVRIYDVLLQYDDLIATDRFFRRVLEADEFRHRMGTAELHYRLGRYADQRERTLALGPVSALAAAYRAAVPVFTSSPGDSSIGMVQAAMALGGSRFELDVLQDVNDTAAIVYDATRQGTSGVWILGGGSPKNFVLQTEPHIQQMLGLKGGGHDYFLQITDARPDTGGLSGATPSEAVSWGKINPDRLPDAVVCYCDTTIALPLLCAYVLAKVPSRDARRLYDRLGALRQRLADDHRATPDQDDPT